jgi:hypothetical protein
MQVLYNISSFLTGICMAFLSNPGYQSSCPQTSIVILHWTAY